MREGDWVRLGATLSSNAGLFKIVSMNGQIVTVRDEDGKTHHILRDQFAALSKSPVTEKRRFAKKLNFFRQDEGMLAAADYHVGITGHDRAHRRAILRWVFEAPLDYLPRVGDDEYRAEWGEPRSWRRYNKIFSCLTSFAQNALSRRNRPTEAVEDWQEDCQWFYQTFRDSILNHASAAVSAS